MERFKEEIADRAYKTLRATGIIRLQKIVQDRPEVIKPNELIRIKHSSNKKEILIATGALLIGGIAGFVFHRVKRQK